MYNNKVKIVNSGPNKNEARIFGFTKEEFSYLRIKAVFIYLILQFYALAYNLGYYWMFKIDIASKTQPLEYLFLAFKAETLIIIFGIIFITSFIIVITKLVQLADNWYRKRKQKSDSKKEIKEVNNKKKRWIEIISKWIKKNRVFSLILFAVGYSFFIFWQFRDFYCDQNDNDKDLLRFSIYFICINLLLAFLTFFKTEISSYYKKIILTYCLIVSFMLLCFTRGVSDGIHESERQGHRIKKHFFKYNGQVYDFKKDTSLTFIGENWNYMFFGRDSVIVAPKSELKNWKKL